MPRDILAADPMTLAGDEHADLVDAWDAAVAKAEAGGAKWKPINPAAILATDQYSDRPELRRELTRSHVRLPAVPFVPFIESWPCPRFTKPTPCEWSTLAQPL